MKTPSEVKILLVEQKGKKYLVYTDIDDDPIIFTEDGLVENRIIKGTTFDKKEWKSIVKNKDNLLMFDKVLHYIDFKPRTTKEVIKYLKDKEVNTNDINKIITRLENIHYLDDDKYASQFILEGIKNKKGPSLIVYQLEQLGIESSTINQMIKEYDTDTEYYNAYDVASKYQKQNAKYPAKKQKELIYQKLLRNGYHSEIINRVLGTLEYTKDSQENLEKEYEQLLHKTTDRNKIITSLLTKGYKYENIKKLFNK